MNKGGNDGEGGYTQLRALQSLSSTDLSRYVGRREEEGKVAITQEIFKCKR
ncbi:hypothetical protein I79_007432 [Cricetulus griseus]|uniref:Uncharacterized protein n=1 Tax=Cricetulus griseus TaxID=10029 RepID=G3HAH9_CRIGR|nr:hypothetical protein I79_007432 [Cricetulus griseus]